jgi:hypothetical protein
VDRGPFLTSPLATRGEICPLGGMFNPSFTLGVNTLYCLEEWRDEQRISPPGDKIHPRGPTSPLGAKLWMGLCVLVSSSCVQLVVHICRPLGQGLLFPFSLCGEAVFQDV